MLVITRRLDEALVVQLDESQLQDYLQTPVNRREPLLVKITKVSRNSASIGCEGPRVFQIVRGEILNPSVLVRSNALILTRKPQTSIVVRLDDDQIQDYLRQDATERKPLTILVSGFLGTSVKLLFGGPRVFQVMRSEIAGNITRGTAPPADDDPHPPAFSPQPS